MRVFAKEMRPGYVWLFVFIYSMTVSLLFQQVVLPLLPALHAGAGLLKNDAYFYHQAALALVENIRLHGWSVWSFWSTQTNTTGNVGILTLLYALFSPNPALILPVNAFFHATSAALLLLIGRELWPGRAGTLAGLVAAVLFTIFPSSLSWYSQPLKDSYVIAGILIILFSWIRVLRTESPKHGFLPVFALFVSGVFLVALVKAYYLELLFVFVVIAVCLTAIQLRLQNPQRIRVLAFYMLAGAFLLVTASVIKPHLSASGVGETYADMEIAGWKWRHSPWLPDPLEAKLEIAAKTRMGMIRYNEEVGAGSLIDGDAAPQSAREMLQYLPRALQIGLFAPFPGTWLQKPSASRLIVAVETACWYLLAPGLLLALYLRRSPPLVLTILFACFFLIVFSFVTPNVGTLYRFRYVFEFLLIAVAAGGWIQFYLNYRDKAWAGATTGQRSRAGRDGNQAVMDKPQPSFSRKKLASTALMVSLLTFVGYLGFFARDIFMVRSYGAGNEMDIFFLGSMIPMFFVSVLSMPIGVSIIPAYSRLQGLSDSATANRLIGSTICLQALFMAGLSVLLFLVAPYLFSALGWEYPAEKLSEIHVVMNVYLLIMLIGGLIIAANAVLNAEQRLVYPALVQLVVPVIAVLALIVFGEAHGIYAAAFGMLFGQVANLILVLIALRGRGLPGSFRPSWAVLRGNFPFRQYGILVAAALSTAMFVPLSNSIAATLPAGSVAIIGMGTKVIMLITGVIGMGMTTVLLPYFSALIAKSHHLKAQSDLSFFLLFAVFISVPVALILRLIAAAVTYRLVEGSAMGEQDINDLIRTVQYGVAQLPFFVCSLIAVKYITACQRAGVILLSSLVGLTLTVVLSLSFVASMGVSGISLAMTIAVAVSTAILASYLSYLKHFPVKDLIFIWANWLAFGAMFIGLHFHMIAELLALGVIYSLLSFSMLKTLTAGKNAEKGPRGIEQPSGITSGR